ncbi:DgyrCDS10633 [Dimorphilus gyrociliatus]|uniref:DgyrCDS10633 n=1 Tax=Dimorphilus gyrociliatus TaxID=2664684 RepID=A0A7I8W207_9ANNE|nr:DgyrCDS10633 [Dimorphilus gyrociliatus]
MSGCDTFVSLPPATGGNFVVFGKNADRPDDEVQEVIFISSIINPAGGKVKCTYIEVEQVEKTYAVVLSKPAWIWGAEMGANEKGVAIGNEAVWTHMGGKEDLQEKLLGMDLLRLGLERGGTAREALEVITNLLERYGQGGPCSEQLGGSSFAYHNSFLIADPKEAWVLETAGNVWAAELIKEGIRNISNQLTIRKNITLNSTNMKEIAIEKNLWNKDDGEEFDFAKVFSFQFEETELGDGQPNSRQLWGTKLLKEASVDGVTVSKMMDILRHKESGICMEGCFRSAGSQVSVLSENSIHFFTATPIPTESFFKPFVFVDNIKFGNLTISPTYKDDPAKVKPRFRKRVDRRHELWKGHDKLMEQLSCSDEEEAEKGRKCIENLRELEKNCISDIIEAVEHGEEASAKLVNIFDHMVQLELNFYSQFDAE